jgi:hypothetical protein
MEPSQSVIFVEAEDLRFSIHRRDAELAEKNWFIEDQREDCSLSLREDARVRGRS